MIKKFKDSLNKKKRIDGGERPNGVSPVVEEIINEIEYSDNLFSSPEKDDGVAQGSRMASPPSGESGIIKSENNTQQTTRSQITSEASDLTPPSPSLPSWGKGDRESLPVPSWHHPIQRKHLKNRLIQDLLTQYNQPFKMDDGTTFHPSIKDYNEYADLLKNCKITRLQQMGHVMKYDLKLDLMDRLKSVNKKEHAVVTIFNDNQTTDTGVINCYDRVFSRNGMTYMVMTERGRYDPEFKMMHFYYFANRTCPIEFVKGKLATDAYDAKLIESTITMKVIEALAAIDMEKFIKIILILLIIMSLLLVVDTFTIMKIAKVVGAKITGG